ncbi:MAG: pyridoxal phosphate-dependent aminotransferase [Pseudomonadota bacterium]
MSDITTKSKLPGPAPRYTQIVEGLPATVPFVGPEAQERARGQQFRARIGANESVFGPSPKAIAAMQHAANEVWRYGDPENHELRHALAAHHSVAPENIVVGEGIDGLLGFLARLLVQPGAPVVTSDGAYPTFNYHVAGFGGRLVKVPYKHDAEDLDALVTAANAEQAALVYVSNPDNPMGSWHPADAITAMIDALPGDAVFCLDEAYIEFAPEGTAPPIDVSIENVIRFRTFSKAHGMAGARIGYAIAHADLIRSFDKIRNHFGVNRIAQAGALAALHDQAWLDDVAGRVSASRGRIAAIARDNGLIPLPSAANFVAIDCGGDGDFARKVLDGLIERGCFVRMPFVAPQDRCIRVTAGTSGDLDVFAETLPQALADARRAS